VAHRTNSGRRAAENLSAGAAHATREALAGAAEGLDAAAEASWAILPRSVPAQLERKTGRLLTSPRLLRSSGDVHVIGQPPSQAHVARPQPTLRYIGTFMVTCYDLYGLTATGAAAGPESVAVDPSVISLGTKIYVQGVGARTADDTGGAIVGDHIDIWEPDYSECAAWGVQDRPVYVLTD
jgi:3D (Asp-Asp-Asp) domain-containing protein